MKKCPFCAEEIQDEAKLCRWCHRSLDPSVPDTPPIPPASGRTSPLAVVGLLVAVCGVLGAFYFFAVFDATVPSDEGRRTYNLGLLSDRQNGLLFCALLAVLGFGAFALARWSTAAWPLRPSRRILWIILALVAAGLATAAITGDLAEWWLNLVWMFG